MIVVTLTDADEAKLAKLFNELAERRRVAEELKIGSRERALAFREVTAASV
ncbi:MAG TPA: hypothetical protein VMV53_07270 [Acidimicrobiales bacterium]|nr:hypothetical protein [Acidimicrobiales bacterium]